MASTLAYAIAVPCARSASDAGISDAGVADEDESEAMGGGLLTSAADFSLGGGLPETSAAEWDAAVACTAEEMDRAGLPPAETRSPDRHDDDVSDDEEYEQHHHAYEKTAEEGLSRDMLKGMLWQWSAKQEKLGFNRGMDREQLAALVRQHDNAHDRPTAGSTEVPVELLGQDPTGQGDTRRTDQELHELRRASGVWRKIVNVLKIR